MKLTILLCLPFLIVAGERVRGSITQDQPLLHAASERGWLIRNDYPKVTSSDSGNRQRGDFRYYWSKLTRGSIEREPFGSGLTEYFHNQDFTYSAQEQTVASISATGDIMFQHNIDNSPTANLYGTPGQLLFGADFVTANLESPLNFEKRPRGFPRFNLDKKMFEKLAGNGKKQFNLFATANNHMFDDGIRGVISTKSILDSCGILSVGTARSAQEQDQFPIVSVKGIKTAFIAFAFGTNRVKQPQTPFYGNIVKLNDINHDQQDFSPIFDQIDSAKARGAEVIWVNLHWGAEWELYPPVRNVTLAHQLAERGATVIIGHHPHCLQPMEKFTTSDGRETFIAYSLGNITFNYHWIEPAKTGGVVSIDFARTLKGMVRISKVNFVPTYHAMNIKWGDKTVGINSQIWGIDEAALALAIDPKHSGFNRRNRKEIMIYTHQLHTAIIGKQAHTILYKPAADQFSAVEWLIQNEQLTADQSGEKNTLPRN